MPTISLVLPTRNNEKDLPPLLDMFFSQDVDADLEAIILDSSDDRTPEIAREYAKKYDIKVTRVEPEDYNYGGTRNQGVRMSRGDYIVFVSTDIQVRDRKWISKLLRHFKDPEVAGVYGRQLPKEDAPPMEEFFIQYTYPPEPKVFSLSGSLHDFFFSNTNSMIRRNVWEKIPLPEMLKSEDQEWGKRAVLAGYKIVYDPEAAVYHSHHYTLKKVFQEYFDSGATLPYVYSDPRIQRDSFILRGLKYEYNGIKYFLKHGYAKWIPYAMLYDFMKFLGYFLGTKHKYMPLWLKRALCKKKNHWDKYDDIISEKFEFKISNSQYRGEAL